MGTLHSPWPVGTAAPESRPGELILIGVGTSSIGGFDAVAGANTAILFGERADSQGLEEWMQ